MFHAAYDINDGQATLTTLFHYVKSHKFCRKSKLLKIAER